MIDWLQFLKQRGIPYVQTTAQKRRGRVNIHCPWCGIQDTGEHLGISVRGYGYSCWRNASHRGTSNIRLVQELTHCSYEEAERLVGGEADLPELEDLAAEWATILGEEPATLKRTVEMPVSFKPIQKPSPYASSFIKYLKGRGYTKNSIAWLGETYELQYAYAGKYAWRIIFPLRDRRERLLTWTARTILPDEELRYFNLRGDQALCSTKETLIGLPYLWRCEDPRVLVICEGPFDAAWLTYHGRALGVYGTCLFGLSLSEPQMVLIDELQRRFDRVVLFLDSTASLQAFQMSQSGLDLDVIQLPSEYKDPASLPEQAVVSLCFDLRRSS